MTPRRLAPSAVRASGRTRTLRRLVLCGLRRGEVLGLGWADIDFDAGAIHVRQQIQRIRGELVLSPVKTHAGRRTLPLLDPARQALKLQAERQATHRADMGTAWPPTNPAPSRMTCVNDAKYGTGDDRDKTQCDGPFDALVNSRYQCAEIGKLTKP